MSNTNHISSAGNPKIEVIEVVGGLFGSGALEIQTYLCRCLDEGRCYQIIDLHRVNQIDGLGISVLENFLSRGLEMRFMNVKPEVKSVIGMAEKAALLQRMYNEKDRTKAVALFEKEVLEKRVVHGEGILKKRRHIRVDTSFPSEFKFRRNHETVSGRAQILNLSEGGVLAGQIVALNEHAEEMIPRQGMIEREICNLKFRLNGDAASITAQGTCVREFMSGESLCAGICFGDISHRQREIIRSFVDIHGAAKLQ